VELLPDNVETRPVAEVTDDDLMRMYVDGDDDAFNALFDRHYRSVYNFAYSMLTNAAHAQDVLQESFLTVVRSGRRYEPQGHFRTWLLRICRNRCLNLLESDRLHREALGRNGLELLSPALPATPATQTVREERVAAIRRGMARLPERQREALTLYAFEKMRYQDIAEVLQIPVNSVKTLIHRSRATLARFLEQLDEGTTDERTH